jgi:hypothetical protein
MRDYSIAQNEIRIVEEANAVWLHSSCGLGTGTQLPESSSSRTKLQL